MQLSKGFDYAVRSMIHLALLPEGKTAELKAIAEAQNVPASYLAKVMRSLVRSGLVASTLGRDGGYALRKAPEAVTLLQIFEAIEGRIRLVDCLEGEGNCAFVGGCAQASVWRRLTDTVEGFFRETSLGDLLPQSRGERGMEEPKEKSYARTGA